jgi:hypothetical protein
MSMYKTIPVNQIIVCGNFHGIERNVPITPLKLYGIRGHKEMKQNIKIKI